MQLIDSTVKHLTKHKARIFAITLVLLISKLFGFGVPFALKNLVDSITSANQNSNILIFTPIFLVLSYGLCALFSLVFNELKEFFSANLTQEVIANLAVRIFKEIHALPTQYLLKKQSGVITREIDRGIRGLQLIISVAIHSLIPAVFEFFIVVIYFFFSYDFIFLVILISSLMSYILFTVLVTKILVRMKNELNEADSNVNQKLVDTLQNAENVKLFGNQDFEIKRFSELSKTHLSNVIKIQKIYTFLSIGQQVIVTLGGCLILWLSVLRIIDGAMMIGDLVMVSTLVMQIFLPISALGVLFKDIRQALVDINNLNQIVESQNSNIINYPNINLPLNQPLSIEFQNVNFSFGDRAAICDLNFKIEAGESIAIVGRSGAGKSTLIKLLFRLYEPASGRILIQGQDISKFNIESIRSLIGVVPQDISLFNGTISYNIAYGNILANRNDIDSVSEIAQLHELIAKLPGGYETIVGERGQMLSGGERQRVGIARALIKKPSILVFDEASSALDSKTEAAIQHNILSSLENKTTLTITHRLSTIKDIDKIFVMERGRLVAVGTHNELLNSSKTYQDLWST